nr:RLA class II histocompatibility antigen, DP alpha-1 chain-like [Anolis sagrei ordinatus]
MAAAAPAALGALPWLLALALLLLVGSTGAAVETEADYVGLRFFQENFPAGPKAAETEAGEYLDEFEGEAIFQVDWAQKTTSWRLPDFARFATFESTIALGYLSGIKQNLEALMALSNRTRGQSAAPSAKVYPKYPVELGDPNALICFLDRFSPPVLNITWLKNGEVVSEGVQETGILPSVDFAFRKFSYLPFIPEEGDFYTCRVEHWGLPEPLTVIWSPEESTPLPDTAENVLCGLGLAFGILGIIVGTVLFFKAMRMTNRNTL